MNERMINIINSLPNEQKKYVLDNFANKEKSLFIGYLLWFFFGCHYFYVGKPFVNILYIITGGGFLIWAFFDLFRMKSIIQKKNEEIILNLIYESKMFYNT